MVGLTSFTLVGDQTVFTGVGLEDTAALGGVRPTNRVRQIGDRVFFWHKSVIYELIDGVWTSVFTIAAPAMSGGLQFGSHSGLHFWQDLSTGQFGLVGDWRTAANFYAAIRYEYTTNTWSTHVSAFNQTQQSGYHKDAVYRNTLYHSPTTGAVFFTFDPITLGFTTAAAPWVASDNAWFVVANGSLFYMNHIASGQTARLYQLVGGAFVVVASQGSLSGAGETQTGGQLAAYYHSGSLWFATSNNGDTAHRAFEIDLSTFVVTERTSTLLPPYLRTSGATGTDERLWTYRAVVDQEDLLGTLKPFVLWQPGNALQGINVFEHVQPGDGSTAVWTDRGGSQMTGAYAVPNQINGGSDGIFTLGETFGLVTKYTPASAGGDLTVKLWGDPIVLEHGAVTSGPFEEGQTIEQTTGAGSGTQGTIMRVFSGKITVSQTSGGSGFENGETITQTTGPNTGANASTTAAPTGGAADKFGRIRFDTGENAANTVAQLATPLSGLVAPMTLNANDYETAIADGFTEYLVKHNTIADGIPNAAPISYFVEVESP
jgi:hypothetical protein